MYQELTELASERSSERRVELLRRLTDLFISCDTGHSDVESFLFGEIMDKIVDQISREARIQVAVNLGTLPEFPRDLVRKLADDEDIDVARPVLRASPVLTDDDLIEIMMKASQAHLAAIASRPALSEQVTDVLIDRGDSIVVRTVTGNHGARFSGSGWDQLMKKASADIDLQELLVERPDLSPKAVTELLPLVSKALVVKLAERGHDVQDMLSPEMLANVRRRFAEALKNRRQNIRLVSELVEDIRGRKMTLDQAVTRVARDERMLDVASLIAHFAPVDRNFLFNVIARGQVQTLLVLFRSLNLQWSTLECVLELRAKKQRAVHSGNSELRRDYETIDPALAQRTIRFLQVRRRVSLDDPAGEPMAASA